MNTVRVEKKNEEGKIIIKDISSELLSLYLATGWVKSNEKKAFKPIQPKVGIDE